MTAPITRAARAAEAVAAARDLGLRLGRQAVATAPPVDVIAHLESCITPAAAAIRPLRVTGPDVLRVVSRVFGVTVEDIRSDRRTMAIIPARFAAAYLAKELTRLSYPRIGERLHRDHSTVMSAIRRANEMIATDPDFAALVTRARGELETLTR